MSARRGGARLASEAVGSAELRTLEGLHPSDTLLFNGWGVTPAGRHVRLEGHADAIANLAGPPVELFQGRVLDIYDSVAREFDLKVIDATPEIDEQQRLVRRMVQRVLRGIEPVAKAV